jgi:menaquinol-cytochrome c reductase iron-sulfur subunit
MIRGGLSMAEEEIAPPPGDEPSRRTLLAIFSKSLLGVVAAGTLLGPIAMLLHPALTSEKEGSNEDWFDLGPLSRFEVGALPQSVVLRKDRRDAWLLNKNVAVGGVLVSRSSPDTFSVFSSVCPHLGCTVRPKGDSGFLCPCHNSVFKADGSLVLNAGGGGNPSPRALDSLDWRIAETNLQIRWVKFEMGIPDKKPIS